MRKEHSIPDPPNKSDAWAMAVTSLLRTITGADQRTLDMSRLTREEVLDLIEEAGPDLSQIRTPIETTSGTEHTYSAIPPWVRQILMVFNEVSVDSTQRMKVRLGANGTVESTGYEGTNHEWGGTRVTHSDAFDITHSATAAIQLSGIFSVALIDSSTNEWAASWNLARTDGAGGFTGAGNKSLLGTLDAIRLAVDTGAFDGGKINIHQVWAP